MLLLLAGGIGDGVDGGAEFARCPLEPGEDGQDLIQRLLGAAGEVTHLIGHHGEPSAMLSGAGGFDGGVERQQIGLFGDVADHIDDGGGVGHRLVEQA